MGESEEGTGSALPALLRPPNRFRLRVLQRQKELKFSSSPLMHFDIFSLRRVTTSLRPRCIFRFCEIFSASISMNQY